MHTTLTRIDAGLLRYSLVVLWLVTAFASVWELHGQSAQLLASLHSLSARQIQALIVGGAAVDAALGLALWLRPVRSVYLAALAVMLVMTLMATLIQPDWWLHPLGPLTKNLPVAAVLIVLAKKP